MGMKLRWLYAHLEAVPRLYSRRLLSAFCALVFASVVVVPARADSPCGFSLEGVAARMPETQALSAALFKKYPMNDYEYVFVGRSLTVLYAFLKAQATMYPKLKLWNLPLSLKDQRTVSEAEYVRRFEEVFYRFRGSRDLGSRKLVFVDYVDTGRTMKSLDWLLRRSGIPGELAGVTDNSLIVSENLRMNSSAAMRPLELFPISLEMQLAIGTDRWYAPYPQGPIGDADFDPAVLRPADVQPRFTDTVNAFKLEMFGFI